MNCRNFILRYCVLIFCVVLSCLSANAQSSDRTLLQVCDNQLPVQVGDSALYVEGNYDIVINPDSVAHIRLVVNVSPVFEISTGQSSPSGCPGFSVYLTVNYNQNWNYQWSDGNTDDYRRINPSQTAYYAVTVTDRRNNCSNVDSILLTVYPTYEIYDTLIFCRNELPKQFGDLQIAEAGDYVAHFNTVHSCDSIVHAHISIAENPVPVIMGDTFHCANTPVMVYVNPIYSHYRWNDDSENYFASISDDYAWVQVTDENGCVGNSAVRSFTILPVPTITISGDSNICYQDTTCIVAHGGVRYQWTDAMNVLMFRSDTFALSPRINQNYQEKFTLMGFGENSCYSRISFKIFAHPIFDTDIYDTCCSADLPYHFHDYELPDEGVYEIHLQSQYGCDSLVRVHLHVIESPYALITPLKDSICPGLSTYLMAQGNGSYRWNTGATTPSLMVSDTGNYVLEVTATNGCRSYDTVYIGYYQIPMVSIEGDSSICLGEQLTLVAKGASIYYWDTGTRTDTLRITPMQPTSYSVVGTAENGCTASAVKWVNIKETPHAQISGESSICSGSSTYLFATGGDHFLWSTGEETQAILVSEAQTYSVLITADNGCSATASKTVTMKDIPSLVIAGDTAFCEGGSTTLTVSSDMVAQFIWNGTILGNGITVNEPGVYTVMAISTNNCSSTKSVQVSEYGIPEITLTGNPVFCTGSTTIMKAAGGVAYSWINAFGTEVSTSDSLILSEEGQYTIIVYNEHQCSASQMFTAEKKPLPIAAIITGDETEGCEGYVHATLTAVNGPNYHFLWNTGDTTRSISVSTGNVYVVTVTANACSSKDSIEVIVHPRPAITFSGNTDICLGDTAHITAHADNALAYLWTTLEAGDHISVAPLTNTIYTVTVTDIYRCVNINSIQVIVYDRPSASIVGLDSLCGGDSLLLQAQGGSRYLWNDGDTSASRYVFAPGVYSVQVFNSGGCYSVATKQIYGYETSNVAISGQMIICTGDSTTLTAHGGVSYLWSTGSTDSTIVVGEPGLYYVSAWNAKGCMAFDSATVSYYEIPEVYISGDSIVCFGDSTLLTAHASEAGEFIWNTHVVDTAIWVNEAGVYSVVFTDEHQCKTNADFQFGIMPTPECHVIGETTICLGDTTTLMAVDGFNHYWSTGDTATSITIAPDTTTVYTLYFIDSLGCNGEKQIQVIVNQYVPLNIVGNTDFCMGDSTLLVASGAAQLVWSTGVEGDSLWVKESGVYSVSSRDSHACAMATQIEVAQHQLPQVGIEGPILICSGDTAELRAVCNERATYVWNNQSTDSVIHVTTMGVYSVVATSAYGCVNQAAKLLTVYSRPTLTINAPQRICHNDTITLRAVSNNAIRFIWSTGDSTAEIQVVAAENTTYTVDAYNQYGCSNTASVETHVIDLPVVTIEGDANICEGETTTLTCSQALTYHWSTGERTQSITVDQPGNYSVEVSNAQGCVNSANIEVAVHSYPNATIQGDSVLCAGKSEILIAMGGISYLWSNGSTDQIISVAPTSDTAYSVLVSNGYCSATASISIRIIEKPQITIIGPDQLCEGDTASLIAQGGNVYLWNTGAISNILQIVDGGSYQVVGYDNMGCADTARHDVSILSNPAMIVTGTSEICEGDMGYVAATGEGSFVWNTGDTTSFINISNSGNYQVMRTNENGCVATGSHMVEALLTPVITILGTHDHCFGDTTILVANCQNATSFQWNTGATDNVIAVSPQIPTNYYVSAVSSDNCTAVENHELAVHFPSSVSFVDNVCQGQPYTQYGFNIPAQDESGTFTFVDSTQTVFGCDSIRTLTLTVEPIPEMPANIIGMPTIYSFGNYVYQITAVAGAESYEWIMSNPSWPVQYNQTVAQVAINTPGVGTLSVYAFNHCGVSDPGTLQITCSTGINGYETTTVAVYPNPTENVVNVKIEEQQFDNLALYDIFGRILFEQTIESSLTIVDLSNYASGIYLVKLKNTRTQFETSVKVIRN